MRFDLLDDCWQAMPSAAGPAGTIGLSWRDLLVDFDAVDHGRLVRLEVPLEAGREGQLLLGPVWSELVSMLDAPGGAAVVELTGTPLWRHRFALAAAGQLAADLDWLIGERAESAAVLAAAELADVLHGLGALAPQQVGGVLERGRELLWDAAPDGRLLLPATSIPTARELAGRLSGWAPAQYQQLVGALRDAAEQPRTQDHQPQLVRTLGSGVAAATGRPTAALDSPGGRTTILRVGVREAAVQLWGGTGFARRLDHGVIEIEIPFAAAGDEPWCLLFQADSAAAGSAGPEHSVLVAGGPLARGESTWIGWFGPLTDRSTSVVVLDNPFVLESVDPVERIRRAVSAGRDAIHAEPVEPAAAAARWESCADDWLALGELGRAAIAYDRAALAFDRARRGGRGRGALDARRRAAAFATAWAAPYLDGRSGQPYHPMWRMVESN